MKEQIFVLICFAIMLGLVGISVADGINKFQLTYTSEEKAMLNDKGFNNLPRSDITCDGINNCTYTITRADKDFVRDLGTKDMKIAEGLKDKDSKDYMDSWLQKFKDEKTAKESKSAPIDKIEVVEK
jgi:hypothetical protein